MNPTALYEEILRRAELFSYIAEIVKTEQPPASVRPDRRSLASPETASESAGPAGIRLESAARLPRIAVVDRRLVCNGTSVDLARRPLVLKLFSVFLATPGHSLTREELLFRVYGVSSDGGYSERYVESCFNNAVKLISRARIVISTALDHGMTRGIEWLVYDQNRKVWDLYRLRNEYLNGTLLEA